MNDLFKTKEILLKELHELRVANNSLKIVFKNEESVHNLSNDALIETNSRLSLALRGGNMAWWEMNVQTGSVTFDKLKVEMLGYSPENFKHYTDFTKLVHPDDYNRIMDAMRGHFEGKFKNYDVEYRMLTQSGDYEWFYDYGSVVKKDLNGKPLICTGFVYKINERKKAEEKMLFILKAVDSTSDAIGILDAQGHHYYHNKAFSDLFGYDSVEEIIAAGGGSALIKDPVLGKKYFDEILTGKYLSRELDMVTKNRKVFHSLTRTDSLKNSQGKILGAIAIITDITERKQSEEVLRKSDQMLQTVLNNFPGVVFWKDRESRYLGCNQSFATGAGFFNPVDIEGKTDYDMPWGATEGEHYRVDDIEVIENGREKLHILEMQHQTNGKVIWLDTSKFTLHDSQGQVIGVIGVSNDISKLKMAEQELITNNKELVFQNKVKEKQAAELIIVNNELLLQISKHKLAEEALKESEERFRTIFENSTVGIYRTTPEGQILLANPTLVKLLGYSTFEELAGRNLQKNGFEPSYERSFFMDVLEREGEVKGLESAWTKMNGTRLFVNESARAITDKEGKLLYYDGIVEDITQRKQAEELLRKSEQMLQTVLDNFPGVVSWKDKHSIYLGCNQTFATGAGLKSPAEILGKTDLEMPWATTEAVNYLEDDKNVMESGKGRLHIIETQHQSDGCLISLDTSKLPLLDSNGQIIGVICVSNDISKLKMAEQELLMTNKSLALQYKETGKRAAELAIANTELIFQNIEKEKRKAELELRVEERTGQLAETNRNLHYEIDERIRKEDQLIIQSTALNAVANAIMISDKSGNVQWINKAFTVLTGYSRKEVIGFNPRVLKSDKHEPDFYKEIWDTILVGKVWNGELINKRKDGSLYNEEMTITPLKNKSGLIVRFIAVKNDITHRKKAEVELKKAKKEAEDANKMKSEFLANMSHEIRTPLNSIVGFSNILKERLTGQNVYTEYLDNIMLSSKMLLNLINDILDLSKVEAGKIVIEYHAINLKNIVEEIETVFRMKALEKGVALNFILSDDIPECLMTDERYLRQILFNLIGNALKFTHKGSVDVQITVIQKAPDGSKVDLKFTIKDTGIGVQANELASIFEPFIQASKKDRNRYGGTGLGLSITKRLVELLGGTISVESEIDKGSVFSFSLLNSKIISRKSVGKDDIVTHFPPKIKFKNPILLLTEDMLSNRQVIRGYLETLNITIIEAVNGKECLNAIRIQRPDLILMDMEMPVMDGYTAINIIKSDESLRNIPLIALSASGMTGQKSKMKTIADDFLLKPIDKEVLIAKLMKYLPYKKICSQEVLLDHDSNEDSTIGKSTQILTSDIKTELIHTFLPSISKQLNTLNIDEIIGLVKKMGEYNKELQNYEISEYCSLLSKSIESFNISKISALLKQLSTFITN